MTSRTLDSPASASPAIRPAVHLLLTIAIIWALAFQVRNVIEACLAAAIVVVCSAGVYLSTVGGARLCQIVFWSFIGCWLGIAPMYQLSQSRVAWSDSVVLLEHRVVVFAQVLILVSLLAFFCGALWRRRRRTEASSPLNNRSFQQGRVAPLFLLGFLGLALLPLASYFSGGIANLFSARADRGAALQNNGLSVAQGGGPLLGLVSSFTAAIAVAVCFTAVSVYRSTNKTLFREKQASLVLAVALGLMLIGLYCNPMGNTRFVSAGAIGAILLALVRPKSSMAGVLTSASFVVAFLFVYPLLFALRESSDLTQLNFSLTDWAGIDFDGFQQLLNTVTYVEQEGIQNGIHVLAAVFFFVPRSAWTGKPEIASASVAEERGYDFLNLSLPLPAEFYLDLGVVGLIVVMFFWGFVWEHLDQSWLSNSSSMPSALVPLIAMQQIGIIRGPLGAQAPIFGTVLALSAVAVFACRQREPSHEAVSARRGATV